MLFPLLGAEVAARLRAGAPRLRRVILGTVALMVFALALVGTEMRFNWVSAIFGPALLARGTDVSGGIDWTGLEPALAARGLLTQPNLVIAVTRWNDAGKVDYALGGGWPVTVLADDSREYGIVAPAGRFVGQPMLILVPDPNPAALAARLAPFFSTIKVLPPVTLRFGGYPFMTLAVLAGDRFLGFPADRQR
jgi:hypothetical protein